MNILSLTEQEISALSVDDVATLAQRLEQDDYTNPFEALKDWHLLRAIAFQRQDLAEPYAYLLDMEAYDES